MTHSKQKACSEGEWEAVDGLGTSVRAVYSTVVNLATTILKTLLAALLASFEKQGLEARLIEQPLGAYLTSPDGVEMHLTINEMSGNATYAIIEVRHICGDSESFTRHATRLVESSSAETSSLEARTQGPDPAMLKTPPQGQPVEGDRNRRHPVTVAVASHAELIQEPRPVDFLLGRFGKPGSANPFVNWPRNKCVDDFIHRHIIEFKKADKSRQLELRMAAEKLVYCDGGRFLRPAYHDEAPNNISKWIDIRGDQWLGEGVKAPKLLKRPRRDARSVIREKFAYQLKKLTSSQHPARSTELNRRIGGALAARTCPHQAGQGQTISPEQSCPDGLAVMNAPSLQSFVGQDQMPPDWTAQPLAEQVRESQRLVESSSGLVSVHVSDITSPPSQAETISIEQYCPPQNLAETNVSLPVHAGPSQTARLQTDAVEQTESSQPQDEPDQRVASANPHRPVPPDQSVGKWKEGWARVYRSQEPRFLSPVGRWRFRDRYGYHRDHRVVGWRIRDRYGYHRDHRGAGLW